MKAYANQPIGTVPELRRLRREAPEPERRLLRAVKESFPDLRWRHQSPLGPYKADLLCFSERLVIEVDGDTHVATESHDLRRTAYFESLGYRVARFNNADVMGNLEGVIASISLSFQEREKAPQARVGEDRAGSDTAA